MQRSTQSRNEQSGLLSSARTLLMKVQTTFYRRMVLVERALDPPPSMPELTMPVEIGPLRSPADLIDVSGFRPALSSSSIRQRVERGNDCFAVWLEGRIVHTAWVAVGQAWVEYLSSALVLGRDDVYVFDTYTSPDFRNLHLAQARAAVMYDFYLERGYQRSLGLVAVENRPGLAVPEALGYRRIGLYGALRLGPWHRTWSRPRPGEVIPQLVSLT